MELHLQRETRRPKWYRVAGHGKGGETRKTADEAWESALAGIPEYDRGEYVTAHTLILYAASTRRAADAACVSEVWDIEGTGMFWRDSYYGE